MFCRCVSLPLEGSRIPITAFNKAAGISEVEMRRLDEMHTAFTRYFGGMLCLAPVSEVHPGKILEIGAIQAAEQFPDAHILAVDMSPLPERTLPANMSFKLVDASQELPLEPDFDIVHARMVFCHVLNAAKVIERAARLLKPGGLLLLEDFDVSSVAKTGGPAAQRWTLKYIELCASRGMDSELGRKLEKIMSSVNGLSRVHVHKLSLPMNGAGSDEDLNDLGRALRTFYTRGVEAVLRHPGSHDFTDGMVQDCITELNKQDCTALFDMYFCWAHRTKN
ncbi:S-adenosyl-L-methionine-dependent methyltransferase [Mycena pura]|uniref:S-adenosyl-L-methionine-dependent methyltransferase n=1 Tax=Mycena pura TaxID=153505 RepID=A0AAD6YV01_9AGAR|nr:S-adenosyl-L-methionine-dependent methyltransferase [Mycena pura]